MTENASCNESAADAASPAEAESEGRLEPWPSSGRWLAPVLALGAVLLTLGLYWPAVTLPLMTESYVEQDLARQSPWQFFANSAYLNPKERALYYRPGARLIDHAVNAAAGGVASAELNHGFQLALHVACVVLVFLLVQQMTGGNPWAGFFAALAFGWHPSIVPAPICVAVRWNLSVTLVFLGLVLGIEWGMRRERSKPPVMLFAALAPVLLFLSLIAELGALAMGVVGLWTALRCLRRRSWKWAAGCLGPFAAVPPIYLLMRFNALGHLFRPYTEAPDDVVTRFGLYAHNLIHDTLLYLNPIHLGFMGVPTSDHWGILWRAGLIGLVLAALLFLRPIRKLIAAHPLPFLALGAFTVFQLNALWLIAKRPIPEAGIDRGYVYTFAVCQVAIILGLAIHLAMSKLRGGRLVALGCAVFLYLMLAGYWTQKGVRLWIEGGRILQTHEELLTPFLRDLPEGSRVFMRGFPETLKEPYLPWTLVYSYSNLAILRTWAGKDLDVSWEEQYDHPFLCFRGWLIENTPEALSWRWYEPANPTEDYLQYQMLMGPFPDLALMRWEEEGLNWYIEGFEEMEFAGRQDGAYELEVTGPDPCVPLYLWVDPRNYGVLSLEMKVLELAGEAKESEACVFHRGLYEEIDESAPLTARVTGDGEWQTVRFALFTDPGWLGLEYAWMIRLHPLDAPGRIQVRNIRLTNDLDWTQWTRGVLKKGTE